MYGSISNQNGNAPALNVQIPNYPNPKNSFDLTSIHEFSNF